MVRTITQPKHYGTPNRAAELASLRHGGVTPKHCSCLPCVHHLTQQHIGRESQRR